MFSDLIRGARARIRAIRYKADDARVLDEELQFHLEQLASRFEGQGLPLEEARRRARIELGAAAAIQETCRDTTGANWITDAVRDGALALRNLRREPVFSLAAIFTLTLGIGVNTTLFTAMYSVVFRPLPVANAGSLRNVYQALQVPKGVNRTSYGDQYFESFAEFSYMQERAKTVILAGVADAELSPRGLAVKSLRAQLVSANLLTMMGARPEQGRFFRPEETARPGSAAVVVLSHATWRTHFQGAPDVVGRTLILNRTPFTIIGVTDPKFSGPLALVPDVWIPITMQALTRPGESLVDNPNAAFVQIFSRNRPGFSDDAVKTELGVLGPQSVTAHDSGIKSRIQIVPAAFLNYPEVMGAAMPVLSIIWFIGGLVLVVTCANVANLLLARGLSRRREIAIRLAIGAGRFRLLRQMLTESLLLGFAGGGLGLLLAWQGGAAALRLIPESAGRVQLNLQPDARVLLFAFLVSLAAAIGCGLVPAFHALRVDLTPSLKSEGLLDTARSRRAWLQNALLGVQVAVSVVLLVNAGLLTQAFRRAGVLDTGKDLHGMLITFFDLRQQQFTAERAQRFHEHLAERLTAMPGIMAVSSSLLDPEISSNGSMVSIPGKNGVQGSEFRVAFDEVSPDYFRAAGIRLLAGRSFTQAEVNSREHVIVIDEQLAKKGFEGDPLGRYLDLAVGGSPTNLHRIVGVVANTTAISAVRGSYPTYYIPMQGLRFIEGKLWVRYQGTTGDAARAVRAAVQQEDPDVNPNIHTIEENVERALMPVRMASWLASAIGILALLVAAIGLYGVISFAVNRRLREMGIRMALGAGKRDLVRLVFGQLPGPVGIGSVIGMCVAVALAYVIRGMLYGVSPFDPAALGGVMAILLAVCLAATWLPAKRASGVDPASVLRND